MTFCWWTVKIFNWECAKLGQTSEFIKWIRLRDTKIPWNSVAEVPGRGLPGQKLHRIPWDGIVTSILSSCFFRVISMVLDVLASCYITVHALLLEKCRPFSHDMWFHSSTFRGVAILQKWNRGELMVKMSTFRTCVTAYLFYVLDILIMSLLCACLMSMLMIHYNYIMFFVLTFCGFLLDLLTKEFTMLRRRTIERVPSKIMMMWECHLHDATAGRSAHINTRDTNSYTRIKDVEGTCKAWQRFEDMRTYKNGIV